MRNFFFYDIPPGGAPSLIDPRLGEYSVDGGIEFLVTHNTESNYLFDSTARTAVGNSDFVIVTYIPGTTTSSNTPVDANAHFLFDCQGDGGSGTLLAAGTGTSTAKSAQWGGSRMHLPGMEDDTQVGLFDTTFVVPSYLFGTTDTLRTGRIICQNSAASTDGLIHFSFCSWAATSGQGKLGNFTVDGFQRFSLSSAAQNYLLDSTARTAAGNSDFTIITNFPSTNTQYSVSEIDFQGDGGSGAAIAVGTGTSNGKNCRWRFSSSNTLVVPSSLIGTTDTIRTGRYASGASNQNFMFTFCSWGA